MNKTELDIAIGAGYVTAIEENYVYPHLNFNGKKLFRIDQFEPRRGCDILITDAGLKLGNGAFYERIAAPMINEMKKRN